jgi:hypothetical protein
MATQTKLTGKDILLLLLYTPGLENLPNETIHGRTRFMKMVFLFKEEIYPKFKFDVDGLSEFIAWKFGPWSEGVFADIEFFKSIGFIEVEIEENNSNDLTSEEVEEFEKWEGGISLSDYATEEYQQEIFRLSELGKKYIEDNKIFFSLSDNQKTGLKEFKKKFNGTSLFSILRYVYKKYPTYTKNSKIKDNILS